ncbi:MAG: hypothetical protein JNM89_04610 [Hyphomicrobiaceae bacterium]|nr:hypothetical protein [Hyphomicrobiaceae bacterium]
MDDITLAYQEKAKGLLRAELARRNIGYDKLADLLAEKGVKESGKNLSNKIARGGFSAGFMVLCLEAIGARAVRIDD